ncbi:MAG: protein kinase domain-containing protein [Trueperaceae bacterium]
MRHSTSSHKQRGHAQGIIHRDIKLANLMFAKGQIKILNFGLARLETEDNDGEQVGTLEYMSPEAARGQNLNVTSDLWSLGVVLYELLTGHSPFQASDIAKYFRTRAYFHQRCSLGLAARYRCRFAKTFN